MISCAYALLFTAGGVTYEDVNVAKNKPVNQVPNLERLVLLADNGKNTFYGSYEPTYNGRFPKFTTGHDIYTTTIQENNISTKSLAYCSSSLSSMEIISKLQVVAGQESEFHYPKPEDGELYADICLRAIREDWKNELNERNNAKSSTELVIAPNDKCLNSHIIGLAFQGDISISGMYSRFAPSNTFQVPKINILDTIKLNDLLTKTQIYGVGVHGNQKMALVWYFGHLHIFGKSRMDGLWWPVTEIGQEKNNARTILNFMRKELGVFKKLDDVLARNSFPQRLLGSLRSPTNNFWTGLNNNDNKLIFEITHIELDNNQSTFL